MKWCVASLLRSSVMMVAIAASSRAVPPAVVPLADDPACTAEDRRFIARTFELAHASTLKGDGGHGAILVKDGKILLEFASAGFSTGDVTKHGETGLISQASRQFGLAIFAGATLYTSEEPCIMCCGSIRFAGIRRMVYGVTALQAQRVSGRTLPVRPLQCREVYARLDYPIEIRGPLMEDAGLRLTAEHVAWQRAAHPQQ
jgi:tRNA(Arg) A34 adenosine deaminase TadA